MYRMSVDAYHLLYIHWWKYINALCYNLWGLDPKNSDLNPTDMCAFIVICRCIVLPVHSLVDVDQYSLQPMGRIP